MSFQPEAVAQLEIVVRNERQSDWISTTEPTGEHVGVSADILSKTGEVVSHLPAFLLPWDLPPGEERPVWLTFRAPLRPGEYQLRPGLVHFGRGPRRAAGSPIPLSVTGGIRV